jgi:erythromycin esterase
MAFKELSKLQIQDYPTKLIVFIFILLASITCFGQEKDALNYIKDHAVVIDTNTDDLKDIALLKDELATKRIVGMGEATHGTHEFQALKFSVFKFLVTEMHYKLFGLEAGFAESLVVNDYILYGKGNAKQAIRGMHYWMWSNKDFLKMIEWMRTYNSDKPMEQRIRFYGFDMQLDGYAIQFITSSLKKLDSVYFNTHFSAFPNQHIAYVKFTDSKKDSTQVLLNSVKTYINDQEDNLLKLFSKDELAYLKHSLVLLQQCFDLNTDHTNMMIASLQKRDKYMAENVEWILNFEGPKSKVMLWAHNGHISKSNRMFGDNMGSELAKVYKDHYYSIGFDFNKGSFKAADLKAQNNKIFTVGDAYKGSSSRILSAVPIPAFFIDIDEAVESGSAAKTLFTQKLRMRSIGLNFDSKNEAMFYTSGELYNMYDGLIFVNDTTGIIGLDQ